MMLNKEEYLKMVAQEIMILKHLHSKTNESDANFKLTEKQRTTLEIFRYLAHQGSTMATLVTKGGDWEALEKKTSEMTLEQFPEKIDKELAIITESLHSLSEEQLNEEVEHWGMKMPRKLWFIGVILRQYTAYRMQIFLQLKANGHSELNTSNLWSGQDGQM